MTMLLDLSPLEDAFGDSDLPYTVDIVDMNRVSDKFRRIIEARRTQLSWSANQPQS